MYYYASLNKDNIVEGIQSSTREMSNPNMIQINSMDEDIVARKYENGTFSAEKYLPERSAIELDQFESLKKQQTDLMYELMMNGVI